MASKEPFLIDELQAHARALGIVCVLWGHLEAYLNILLRRLLQMDSEKNSRIVIHNTDFREKLEIVRGLGHSRAQDSAWFRVLNWVITQINDDLRPRRNRFVHDQWGPTEDGLVKKIQMKTGLRKIPPSGAQEFFTEVETIVSVDELNRLGCDIGAMGIRLFALTLTMDESDGRGGEKLEFILSDVAPIPKEVSN